VSSADAFKKLVSSRKESSKDSGSEILAEPSSAPESIETPVASSSPTELKKRGRPATGKRSDAAWIGRTYYVKRETDLDVEDELLNLKRQGVELDKSELVDYLLSAWVKWRNGDDSEILLGEISPRRNKQ
jgi:hypothetical protein